MAAYTGKANFLEGLVIRQTDKAWEIEILQQRYLYPANEFFQGKSAGLRPTFVARPEMIELTPASARPALKGKVHSEVSLDRITEEQGHNGITQGRDLLFSI